jgi:hypothetical protein
LEHRQVIISIHIAKTGGSSFKDLLARAYGERAYFDYEDKPTSREYARITRQRRLLGFRRDLPAQTQIIHGHFFATKYESQFPDAKLAVWLRDPAERLISHFYFWRKHPDPKNSACRRAIEDGFDLEKFIRQRELRNLQTRYLDGKTAEEFDFVGITEEYDRSVALFSRMFGLAGELRAGHFRRNSERVGLCYDVPIELRALIERNHMRDIQVYRAGSERFSRLCMQWAV